MVSLGFDVLLDSVRDPEQSQEASRRFTRVPPTRFARGSSALWPSTIHLESLRTEATLGLRSARVRIRELHS